MTSAKTLCSLTAVAMIACSGTSPPKTGRRSQEVGKRHCPQDTVSSAHRVVGDSIAFELYLPAVAVLGDTIVIRFCVENLANRPLQLLAYGNRILWHYYVRSAAGPMLSSWETELPLPLIDVQLPANKSIESEALWFTGGRFRGGSLRPGPYYIEAVPLLAEPLTYRLIRRIVLRDRR